MRHRVNLIAMIIVLAAFQGVSARMFKWVDDEGNVYYSQHPPADRPAEMIKPHDFAITDDQPRQRLDTLKDKVDTLRKERELGQADTEGAVKRENHKNHNKKACETARQNLRILKTSARIQDKDADGNLYFLDDKTRQDKITDTKRQIQDFCN